MERAKERARADALRAQIDELNGALVVATAEADRALAEAGQQADRLKEQVEALSAEVMRSEKQALAAVGRAERAEADRDAERARAEVLRTVIDELKAEQMTEMHARKLAVARHDAPGGAAVGCGTAPSRGGAAGEGSAGAAQGCVAG